MSSPTYEELAIRTEAPITPEVLSRLASSARAIHAIVGKLTELGELADHYKRFIFYGKPLDRIGICEELGDGQWYDAVLCSVLDTTFSAEQSRNIEKLRARFPNQFTTTDALNRNLTVERAILETLERTDAMSSNVQKFILETVRLNHGLTSDGLVQKMFGEAGLNSPAAIQICDAAAGGMVDSGQLRMSPNASGDMVFQTASPAG